MAIEISKKEGTGVRVLKCICEHEFQDKLYGKGMRVMNNAPSKGSQKERYRCTVCKREQIAR